MKLFYREKGRGNRTLIIVHGLYGASDNWFSVARDLEKDYRIILVDQRNHGQSPHSKEHTYHAMSDDLLELINRLQIEKTILLGHSMGGKTVMRFCLEYPEMVEKMIVVDIAPKSYESFAGYAEITANHNKIIKSLSELDPAQFNNRREIDKILSLSFPQERLRAFLMKNLIRHKEGHYSWQLNLDALKNNMKEIMNGFSDLEIDKNKKIPETIFIKGEASPYIQESDSKIINKFFPNAQIITIPNAGHWVHADKRDLFVKTVRYFLDI